MILPLLALAVTQTHATLTVGDGKTYSRIEDALAAASPNDEIDVYPKADGYVSTALLIRINGLKLVGKEKRIVLDGSPFSYSGVGSVPRAIVQINADGVTVDNFEFENAHNASYNGAGVRINQGSHATIANCDIHGNDMGIMSNGVTGNPHAAEAQMIDHCDIHHNGNLSDPGFNHNLYLGGTSVTVQFCSIHDSLTGHNLKSRAHFTMVRYCEIYSSANRELDFVEAWDTQRANSNAVLIGNVIRKDPNCRGNRMVMDFGAEHGAREGTIYILNNTIVTPFHSPVLNLTTPEVYAHLSNNVIENDQESHPILVGVENGAQLIHANGLTNVISPAYSIEGTAINLQTLYTDTRRRHFDPTQDRRAPTQRPTGNAYTDGEGNRHEVKPKFHHTRTKGWQPTLIAQIGAGD